MFSNTSPEMKDGESGMNEDCLFKYKEILWSIEVVRQNA